MKITIRTKKGHQISGSWGSTDMSDYVRLADVELILQDIQCEVECVGGAEDVRKSIRDYFTEK